MGFKVAIVGAVDSIVASQLKAFSDGLPWSWLLCGEDFSTDGEEQLASLFSQKAPSVVVSLNDSNEVKSSSADLSAIVSECVRHDVPLVHQSSYGAISVGESRDEVLESVLADKLSDDNQLASSEIAVSELPKHIILRSSWVLDEVNTGLFARLLPPLLTNDPSLVVSDHDFGAPVTTMYISNVIIAVIHQILTGASNWGVYHLRSADACSEAEFCDHLVRQVQKELGLTIEFPSVAALDDARRFMSGNAYLSGRRITDDFGIQAPTWRRGFGRNLRAWLHTHAAEYGLEYPVIKD